MTHSNVGLQFYRSRGAFTLVELLVVISIIGLLSSVAVVALSSSRDKARIAAGLQFEASVQHSVGSDIVADWELDEGSGVAARDTSGNNNHATVNGGPAWRCASTNSTYTPTGRGCALSFSSVASNYVATTISGLGDGTVSLWFNNQNSPDGRVILGKRTTGCFSSGIYTCTSCGASGALRIYNTGPEDTITSPLPTNKWMHLAVVRAGNGTEARFYLDGKLALKNAFNLNLNDLVSNIGGTCAGANPFNGYIDNVKVFSLALDAERIQRLYAEELPGHAHLALGDASPR